MRLTLALPHTSQTPSYRLPACSKCSHAVPFTLAIPTRPIRIRDGRINPRKCRTGQALVHAAAACAAVGAAFAAAWPHPSPPRASGAPSLHATAAADRFCARRQAYRDWQAGNKNATGRTRREHSRRVHERYRRTNKRASAVNQATCGSAQLRDAQDFTSWARNPSYGLCAPRPLRMLSRRDEALVAIQRRLGSRKH
eukprot:354234-Chlamydomonas_euryale.AAC.15